RVLRAATTIFVMSLQVFLQAQILGAEGFLGLSHSEQSEAADDLVGRCAWLTLIGEVLPRALLAELGLSRMLLGSSSAEQFLLVLAEEDIPRAEEFLKNAAYAIAELSGGTLQLIWAATENLGAWPVARKRLDDGLRAKTSTPLAGSSEIAHWFAPVNQAAEPLANEYFVDFAAKLPTAAKVGWSSQQPAHLTWDEGQFTWTLREQSALDDDGILFPRRFAPNDEGAPASA